MLIIKILARGLYMFKLNVLLLLIMLTSSLTTFAQANENGEEEKQLDEADLVITNRRLRAANGSLSKWSGTMSLGWQAGSIEKPFAAQRPNITAGADSLTLQYLNANIGVKYRMSTFDSLTLATGVFVTSPLQNTIKTNNQELKDSFKKTQGVYTVSDPNLTYSRISKFAGFQIVSTITPTLITNSQQHNQGYRSNFDFSSTFMHDIKKTGLSLGANIDFNFYTYDTTDKNLASKNIALYPVLEYIINDTLNFRTVAGWQNYQQNRSQKWNTFTKLPVYQSIGLGITLDRNVFLYPNIQFIPSDIRSDRTNIGVSAYINVF